MIAEIYLNSKQAIIIKKCVVGAAKRKKFFDDNDDSPFRASKDFYKVLCDLYPSCSAVLDHPVVDNHPINFCERRHKGPCRIIKKIAIKLFVPLQRIAAS